MLDWLNNYNDFFQTVIIIAGATTLIMVIQIILLVIGIGDDSSFDDVGSGSDFGDVDDVVNDGGILDLFGLRILTLRNFISFCCIGGWSMIVFLDWTKIEWLAIILGIICGIITMFIQSYVFEKLTKFESNGNIDISNAIGKIGTVYLKIPAHKSGKGKINVVVQERFIEVDAVTEGESLPTGTEIKIVDCINDYLVVEKSSL